MTGKWIPLTHPGVVLLEDYLKPLGISNYRLAKETGLTPTRIGQIARGERSITPEAGLKISKFLGMSEGFWVKKQTSYDMHLAKRDHAAELDKIQPLAAASA